MPSPMQAGHTEVLVDHGALMTTKNTQLRRCCKTTSAPAILTPHTHVFANVRVLNDGHLHRAYVRNAPAPPLWSHVAV